MLPLKLNRKRMVASATLAFLLALVSVGIALAHEQRKVGKYTFVVGFVNEPAYVNTPNAIDLRISNTDTKAPVEGLDKTLQAEVTFGGRSMPVKLSARFGQPGAYVGNFIPTRAGAYIFHFTGQVEDQNVDEKFESGPGRFNDAEDPTALDFPDKLMLPQDMTKELQAAQATAATAQTVAFIASVLGVLGLVAGGVSLLRRK